MTTFYLDYEGGNDANDGLTFANRWKTITSGATAARIAPGDTIRVMASPDPTSIGSATWTGGGRPLAKNISSSTNATPIAITTSVAHGLSAGDYVSIVNHTTNTNANGVWKVGTVSSTTVFTIVQMDGTNTTGNGAGGATGNVTKVNNCVIKLASPVTQNIALCGGLGQKPAWTASANVTSVTNTTVWKEGYGSQQIAIQTAFTTGKAAYYALPATLDLSAYQQVTFWIRQNVGNIAAANDLYLALCSDATGDTVVHTCNIPSLVVLNAWIPVTVNLATNLSTTVNSVALYVVTDNGAQTVAIDNIVACKASSSGDSLSLQSLVSKSDGTGDEAWYALQSINYDVAMLANDNGENSNTTNIRGYNGTTETVTTYKRETTKVTPSAGSTTTVQAIQDSGTLGSLITFSGGWNRTDMSTQTGQTWYDGQNGNGTGLSSNGKNYIYVSDINFCRYNDGVVNNSNNMSYGSIYVTACTNNGISVTGGSGSSFTSVWANNCSTGLSLAALVGGNAVTTVKTSENNFLYGVSFTTTCDTTVSTITSGNATIAGITYNTANNCVVGSLTSANGAYAVTFAGTINCYVNGGSSSGSTSATFTPNGTGLIYFNNFTMNDTVEQISGNFGSYTVFSNRHDNTDNNSWQWQGPNTINQQASVVDSPATTAWKMNPVQSTATGQHPLRLKLGTVVCGASTLVTITARMRRGNTGLTMRLICPGGQISGVTSDVYADMTAAANTWETVTITFTPTKAGGVDIYAYAFGGTTYSGYVCNLTASQA